MRKWYHPVTSTYDQRSLISGLQLFSIFLPRYGPLWVHLCLMSLVFFKFLYIKIWFLPNINKRKIHLQIFSPSLTWVRRGAVIQHPWAGYVFSPAMLEVHSIITVKISKEIIKLYIIVRVISVSGLWRSFQQRSLSSIPAWFIKKHFIVDIYIFWISFLLSN